MVHLRVGDRVFEQLFDILPHEFIVGNIAPDCGVPNEDWSVFTPSKEISHFKTDDGDIEQAENFANKYLYGRSHTKEEFSFYLGYYVHLVTDVLWYKRIYQMTKEKFWEQFEKDKEFIWEVKRDWYDLDFRFLRSNPDFWPFDELKKAKEFKNSYMEEFDESAFADRIKYIVEFYESSSVRNLDREYPYLNEIEADRFVEETVAYILSEPKPCSDNRVLSDDILGKFTITKDYMNRLPEEIKKHIDREPFIMEHIGCSRSKILRFSGGLILKIEETCEESIHEYDMMRWLSSYLTVPEVIEHQRLDGWNYILMTELKGKMAVEKEHSMNPEILVHKLALALKELWKVPVINCPYDMSIKNKLRLAKSNIEEGSVNYENFEPETFSEGGFHNINELYQYLEEHAPEEDIVFSHGDFCLPNIFFDGNQAGFIDLGRSGKADRFQDIALCIRSLKHNLEEYYQENHKSNHGLFQLEFEKYKKQLFDELDIRIDQEKIDYYILMDELF